MSDRLLLLVLDATCERAKTYPALYMRRYYAMQAAAYRAEARKRGLIVPCCTH